MKAFAGYECEVTLSRANEAHEAISFDIVKASDSEYGSRNIENFFEEKDGQHLSLNISMVGWRGEEEATISVSRVTKNTSDKISEKLSLRGNAQETLWFDDYKLESNCSFH
jgi:hypothetical protein